VDITRKREEKKKMIKKHVLNTITANYETVSYFYIREKNDVNGNPRYRVYIIDPEVSRVYEIMLKCYDFQIPERIQAHIEKGGK
jgi:hypothetical protein